MQHTNILIISDIEGSSLCRDYESTTFLGRGWPRACLGMSKDVNAVVRALYNAGAREVTVQDFHRTGFNIFPEMIDKRARVVQGYRQGPVPGIGRVHGATGLIMTGMHAPSGANAILAHTLTSRIARLEVNGRLMTEAELFCASLAPFGLVPLFISGCPAACDYAANAIDGLTSFPLHQEIRGSEARAMTWREQMAAAAAAALKSPAGRPFNPKGPFEAKVTLRKGSGEAQKLAARWNLEAHGPQVTIQARDLNRIYLELVRLVYLNRFTQHVLPPGLFLYRIMGRLGLAWIRRQLKNLPPSLR